MSHVLIQRLGAIREEYDAARSVMAYVERSWHQLRDEPEISGIRRPHFRAAQRNLEVTYIIRLFSSFEGILRDYLTRVRPGHVVPRRAEELINRAARQARVPDPIRDAAQAVREYRNAVAHPGVTAIPLAFEQALGRLNRFLARLPDPP